MELPSTSMAASVALVTLNGPSLLGSFHFLLNPSGTTGHLAPPPLVVFPPALELCLSPDRI